MNVIQVTDESMAQVLGENNVVLLDFWADWCVPCKAFSELFLKVSQKHSDVTFGKVDVEKNPHIIEDLNIRSVPTLVVFREGIAVFMESGNFTEAMLDELIYQARHLDMVSVRKNLMIDDHE